MAWLRERATQLERGGLELPPARRCKAARVPAPVFVSLSRLGTCSPFENIPRAKGISISVFFACFVIQRAKDLEFKAGDETLASGGTFGPAGFFSRVVYIPVNIRIFFADILQNVGAFVQCDKYADKYTVI